MSKRYSQSKRAQIYAAYVYAKNNNVPLQNNNVSLTLRRECVWIKDFRIVFVTTGVAGFSSIFWYRTCLLKDQCYLYSNRVYKQMQPLRLDVELLEFSNCFLEIFAFLEL